MNGYEPPGLRVVEPAASTAIGGQVSAALVVVTVVAVGTWVVALTQTSRSIRRYINVLKRRSGGTQLHAVTLPPETGSAEA